MTMVTMAPESLCPFLKIHAPSGSMFMMVTASSFEVGFRAQDVQGRDFAVCM